MNILITGGNGFIAKELVDFFKRDNENNVIALNRNELPILDKRKVDEWFVWNKNKIDVVIHTAVRGGSRLKKDKFDVFYDNINMFLNILYNVEKYNLLLFNFTSGAENLGQFDINGLYGSSKKIISNIIDSVDKNIINLKIYNCFGKYGKDTRFIEGNIKNYINNKDIIIHQDRLFDFIYSEDLYKIIRYYIEKYKDGDVITQKIDCIYRDLIRLSDVANIINNLDSKKVPIIIENDEMSDPYVGSKVWNNLDKIEIIGLNDGVKKVYEYLRRKNEKKNTKLN
jgi:UDP-glucose 4-epimerase